VYDYQRIQISMSCRNPKKQLLCEPHCIKRIDYYGEWWHGKGGCGKYKATPARVGGLL